MIFDWIANSRRMLETGRVSKGDDWEARRVWSQEVAMLRHMRYGSGASEAEMRAAWSSLRGGTAELFSYDPVAVEGKYAQQSAQAAAAGPLQALPDVFVTDAEVARLNSLAAPFHVRAYWARLLVYVKTMRAMGRPAVHDDRVCAHLARDAGIRSRADHAAASVRRWSLACGVPFPEKVVRSGGSAFAVYAPAWAGRGSAAARFSLSDMSGVDALLAKGTFRCPSCGSLFDRAPHSRTDLCPACQAHKRRVDQTASARKNKKSDKIGTLDR